MREAKPPAQDLNWLLSTINSQPSAVATSIGSKLSDEASEHLLSSHRTSMMMNDHHPSPPKGSLSSSLPEGVVDAFEASSTSTAAGIAATPKLIKKAVPAMSSTTPKTTPCEVYKERFKAFQEEHGYIMPILVQANCSWGGVRVPSSADGKKH